MIHLQGWFKRFKPFKQFKSLKMFKSFELFKPFKPFNSFKRFKAFARWFKSSMFKVQRKILPTLATGCLALALSVYRTLTITSTSK